MSSTIPSNPTPLQIPQPRTPRRRTPRLAASLNQSHLSSLNAEISSHLLRGLPAAIPPSLQPPILALLSSPIPPSIAPPLCLAATQLVGGNPNSALNAACALHLVHAVTRAHTARPLTGVTLMSGDGLLVLAYELVARTTETEAEIVVRVLREVARTAGGVAAAEEGEREGELAAGAAACGVLLGGGSEEEVERGRAIGKFAGKLELAAAEAELRLGFGEERGFAVRRLMEEFAACDGFC